jgi:hypothetical protein
MAGILIFSSGLRGLTPVRAALFDTRNVPKPVTVTFSPFLRERVIASRHASSTSDAAFFCNTCLLSGGVYQILFGHGFLVRDMIKPTAL